MLQSEEVEIVVRNKRQITLPAGICERLGISVGDRLEVRLEGETLIARPKKAVAREALRELREVFASAGVGEEELQQYATKIRSRLYSERYEKEA
jgi:AbrB family looped-hinge helix DNA binding protein